MFYYTGIYRKIVLLPTMRHSQKSAHCFTISLVTYTAKEAQNNLPSKTTKPSPILVMGITAQDCSMQNISLRGPGAHERPS